MAQASLDEVNAFLEQFDSYIKNLARLKVPRNVIPSLHVEDEIDEIVQRTRIKLWKMLKKGPIHNPTAYIHTIICTEAVDMVRRYKRTTPLLLNDNGEFCQNMTSCTPGQGPQDPTDIVEQEERVSEVARWAFRAIIDLPPRQQYALLWGLKKQIDDVLPVIDILNEADLSVEKIEIVHEMQERQRLSSLLSLARKKLRQQYEL